VFAWVEKLIHPKRLADVTAGKLERLAEGLREHGRSEHTVKVYLATLHAVMKWAADQDPPLLAKMPKFPASRVNGKKAMKGRPVLVGEFTTMLAAVPGVVGEKAAPSWKRFLWGLWWSGFRLSEALALSWDARRDRLSVDLSGEHVVVTIPGECQKNGRDQLYAVAPEFGEFLRETPPAERHGPVFKLVRETEAGELVPVTNANSVSRTVCRIGEAAGVVVDERVKRNPDGTTRTVRKFASAHDLRRSFASRWSRRVMPVVLKALMRHSDIATTLRHYAAQDAEATADAALAAYHKAVGTADEAGDGNGTGNGNHFGNTQSENPENTGKTA